MPAENGWSEIHTACRFRGHDSRSFAGATLPLVADLDDIVGSDAILASGRASLQQPANGVSFQPSHKENAFRSKAAELGITDVALVKHRGGASGKFQDSGNPAFVDASLVNGDKGRDRALMVEDGMQLHASLFLSE